MKRGEIFWVGARLPERGAKGSYYVVVSRDFIALNDDIETVICAPIYSRWLGLETEVPVSSGEGMERDSAIRCEMTTLLLKTHLRKAVGVLGPNKLRALDRAL